MSLRREAALLIVFDASLLGAFLIALIIIYQKGRLIYIVGSASGPFLCFLQ